MSTSPALTEPHSTANLLHEAARSQAIAATFTCQVMMTQYMHRGCASSLQAEAWHTSRAATDQPTCTTLAAAAAGPMRGQPWCSQRLLLLLLRGGFTHTYASGGNTARLLLLPPLLLPLLPPLLLLLPLPLLLASSCALPSAPMAPGRGHLINALSAATPPCLSRSVMSSLLMNLQQHSTAQQHSAVSGLALLGNKLPQCILVHRRQLVTLLQGPSCCVVLSIGPAVVGDCCCIKTWALACMGDVVCWSCHASTQAHALQRSPAVRGVPHLLL